MNTKVATTIIAALVIFGLFPTLEAEEPPKSNDISMRISLGIAPGIEKADTPTGTIRSEDDIGSRLEILGIKRFWDANMPAIGFSVGGGLFFGTHSQSEPGFDVDIATYGFMAQGGITADMGNGFTLELSPYLGAGSAYNSTENFNDGTGPYLLYGIKGGAFMLFGENIEVGVEVGYEGFTHEQEYDFGSFSDEVTYSGHGAHVALVIGVKL